MSIFRWNDDKIKNKCNYTVTGNEKKAATTILRIQNKKLKLIKFNISSI